MTAKRFGQAVPEDAGLGTHGPGVEVDVQYSVQARHVQQETAERHRLALCRQASAPNRDRYPVRLGGPQHG